MNKNREVEIIKNIERGYDQMAEKFSNTRKHFWSGFEFIPDCFEEGDKILDFGCGNGRLLEILKNKKMEYFGVDVSEKLLKIAREKYNSEKNNFQKISGSPSLPFSDEFFNAVFSISVFHHFPKKYSEEIAKEIFRVTKPGGKIVISVWNIWQRRYFGRIFAGNVIFGKIFQSGKFKGFGWKDIFIPFKNNQGNVFDRYHYVFSKSELAKIFKNSGFEIEKTFILDKKNIVLVGRKK